MRGQVVREQTDVVGVRKITRTWPDTGRVQVRYEARIRVGDNFEQIGTFTSKRAAVAARKAAERAREKPNMKRIQNLVDKLTT